MDKAGISTLVDTLDVDCDGWDAVLMQEGPAPENGSTEIAEIEGGHLLFIGSLHDCHRSACILLHRLWAKIEYKFGQSTGRVVYLDCIFGSIKLRLISSSTKLAWFLLVFFSYDSQQKD